MMSWLERASGRGIGGGEVGWARMKEGRPSQRPSSSSGKMSGGSHQGGGRREVRQVLNRL